MKKTLSGFFIIAALLFAIFTGAQVQAAGSLISVSGDSVIHSSALNRPEMRVITIIFTADDTDGSIPSLTLNGSTTGIKHGSLGGWFAYNIVIDGNHAGTEPTENSEIYIYQSGFDLLGAQGVDQVDNTAERQVYFSDGTSKVKQPVYDTLTVTITQQAVATNSATGTVYLILVAE